MKKLLLLTAVLLSQTALAETPDHEQFAYQEPLYVPRWSNPNLPSDTMPEACRNPEVERYIADWEAGKIDFKTIRANDSIAADQRFCKSLDDKGNVLEVKSCKYQDSPVGYLWKDLSDSPVVIGITDGGMSDHEPHYHAQPECYYVVNGESKTLADGRFVDLRKGQYFYIPGNTIHNTPIYEKGLGVLYWYPKNARFAGFNYHWRRDVKYLTPAEEAFERVDEVRKRDLNIGPYGTNEKVFGKR